MSRRFVLNCLLCAAIIAVTLARLNTAHGEVLFSGQAKVKTQVPLLAVEVKPVRRAAAVATAAANLSPEAISAQAAVALDRDSKLVLWQKNAHERLYPASTTKIITALVARDLYALTDIITVEPADLQFGQTLSWQVGDQVSVDDLLHALLIVSANETGMMLANHSPGGYDGFVTLMNQKAAQLGLSQSYFVNPQGFDDARQQTTAHDLALAALQLLRDDYLAEIVATPAATIATLGGRTLNLRNTNTLLTRTDLGYTVKGIKTGTTDLANEALVSLIERDGQEIIVVVLSAKNRYNDTIAIANEVFDKYIWQQLTPKD